EDPLSRPSPLVCIAVAGPRSPASNDHGAARSQPDLADHEHPLARAAVDPEGHRGGDGSHPRSRAMSRSGDRLAIQRGKHGAWEGHHMTTDRDATSGDLNTNSDPNGLVPARGFEPRTFGLKDRCSNQAELHRLQRIVD